MPEPTRYVIRIDLGTTKSALAYAELPRKRERVGSRASPEGELGRSGRAATRVREFEVPQLAGPPAAPAPPE